MIDAKALNLKIQEIKKRESFSSFMTKGVPIPALPTYSDVDWKTAGDQPFVEIAFGRSEVGGIYANEALCLVEAYRELKPKFTVEIGRYNGVSTRVLSACCKAYGGELLSIDGMQSQGVRKKLESMNLNENVTLVEGWVPWITPDFSWDIDFLFIDGDHSYMSILVDYQYFNYFVKKGGYIAFHDLNIKESQDAVATILERDPLVQVAKVGRILIFRKESERAEKYFQIVKRGK